MVHVAGADQLRSNTGVAVLRAGRQGSQQRAGAGGSMWSVLVFGILTAIFTWVWFGGRGKRKEADAGVQQQQQQDGGAEEPAAAGKAPESTSEQSGAGTEESGRVTSGESRITEPLATAPVQEVLSRCVPETSEDEALRAGSSVQAHGKPGSPALGEAAAQPEGGVYGETLTHAEEGCPAGVPHTYVRDRQSSDTCGVQSNEESIQVPDRDLIQSNEESIQVPDRDLIQSSEESIQVPDRDLIQSNEESIPVPDVQDKDVIQSSVGDMQFPDVPEKDEVQSKLEAMHPPGVLERDVQTILGDFPTGFSDAEQLRCNVEVMSSPDVPERVGLQITDELHPAGILTEASVQASSNLVHPIELHEEDSVYPENVQQKEAVEDSPTDISEREWVQSNGEEPFHATGSVQETVPPITTQKVVHVNGVEEIPVNAEENASASGLLGETSAAFTDQQNSETILDSTQESNIKDTDSFDHDSAPVKDIMESHDHSKQQTDFVKHEYLEKLTDMALDKHSLTDHGDTIEPIVGLQDNTDVASNIISNDPTYKGSTATHISEELTLQGAQSSPVLDTSTMLPLFHQDEEESPGLKGSALGEEACFSNNSDTPFHEDNHLKAKRVAAIQPMQQNVSIGFKVHYITHSDSQIIAVTGDRKELGEWESFVPLTYVKDGIWSNSVTLPVDSSVEWKFVMVENGKIKRWEECPNRRSKAAHDDFETQQWWGHP